MKGKSIIINPCKLKGRMKVPTSKSYGHRALICAAFCNEEILIKEVSLSEDIIATINCLRSLGANFKIIKNKIDDNVNILVNGEKFLKEGSTLFCNESGSTLRFMLPIASMTNRKILLKGKKSLISRPMKIYEDIYKSQNLYYKSGEDFIEIKGKLKPGEYKIPGDISSQFITGLFFILPLLNEDSKIIITNNLQSKSYVDMTLDIMKRFGVIINKISSNEYFIKGQQKYTGLEINNIYEVEGDYSQGAFWIVAAVLNGDLEITGLNHKSIQGDKVIIDIVKRFNGNITPIDDGYLVKKSDIIPGVVDVSECPDLLPILTLLFSKAKGESKIVGAERVRLKESDRLMAIREGLNNIGGYIREEDDKLIINGTTGFIGGTVDSFNDHRIEMTLAIAATLSNKSVEIIDGMSINKSYPKFYEDLKKLGGDFKVI